MLRCELVHAMQLAVHIYLQCTKEMVVEKKRELYLSFFIKEINGLRKSSLLLNVALQARSCRKLRMKRVLISKM